ncbi:MAG: DNA cytosine methyltransferase [Thiovulaceae bacterium]|nr:DNA cytosine methyltransferase [Sulfurimonadaceae bacterium]
MKFVDLFCGGGFGARGAVKAGATPMLAVDAWNIACDTYRDNFPKAEVKCSLIEELDPKALARKFKPDVLLTSPECTSHSLARGARPGSEKSRETAIGIVPWLEAMKPKWMIVENVRQMKKWDRHNELIEAIESYGYSVNDLHLNAADFGTPQSRKRMFLVCDRQGSVITEQELLSSHNKNSKTVEFILDPKDQYASTPLHKPGRAKATLERAERAIKSLGKGVPFLIVYYSSDKAGGWQPLDVPLRTITTVDRFGLVTWHKKEPFIRMLQPSELIQAMAPRSGHLLNHGSRRDKVKLCGNGVCAPVMESIFRKIIQIEENRKILAA